VSPSIPDVLKPTVLLLLMEEIYVTGKILKINNEALSFNHCCSEKTISVTYPECVFVALDIQHGKLMCHVVICGLSGSTIFVHIIS
jgi:hypothetical protein